MLQFKTLEAKIIRALSAIEDGYLLAEQIAENSLHDYYGYTYLLYDVDEDKIVVESLPSGSVFHPKRANNVILLESWTYTRHSDFDWAYDPDFILTEHELEEYNKGMYSDLLDFLDDETWEDRVEMEYISIVHHWITHENRIKENLGMILRDNGVFPEDEVIPYE